MKKLILIILTLFTFNLSYAQLWIELDIGTNETLNEMYFTNDDIGFIVGNNGLLLKTTDGGNNWLPIDAGVTHDLTTISFVDDNTGYINGLKTTDGGTTWFLQPSSEYFGLIHSINQNNIIAGSSISFGGDIYQSTDGGETWAIIANPVFNTIPGTGFYNDCSFINENIGYLSTWYAGLLFRTLDAGSTWSHIDINEVDGDPWLSDDYNSVYFITEDTGLVTHESGVLKTIDGGNTWSEIKPDNSLYLRSIIALSAENYIVVGGYINVESERIYETTDGGTTWMESVSTLEIFYDIKCTTSDCFAIGSNGTVFKKEKWEIVELSVILEGAFDENTNQMRTNLASENLLPSNQPYSVAPYNYAGTESLTNISNITGLGIVDWVLVEARAGTTNDTKVDTKAGLLLKNGNIVGPDGTSPLLFNLPPNSDVHFVVRHRNHLDVMTANSMPRASSMAYDFTSDMQSAFGTSQQNILSNGQAAMIPADITQDHVIQTTDFDQWQSSPALLNVYDLRDVNLDGIVQVTDYDLWFQNKAKVGPSELAY